MLDSISKFNLTLFWDSEKQNYSVWLNLRLLPLLTCFFFQTNCSFCESVLIVLSTFLNQLVFSSSYFEFSHVQFRILSFPEIEFTKTIVKSFLDFCLLLNFSTESACLPPFVFLPQLKDLLDVGLFCYQFLEQFQYGVVKNVSRFRMFRWNKFYLHLTPLTPGFVNGSFYQFQWFIESAVLLCSRKSSLGSFRFYWDLLLECAPRTDFL